MARDTKEEAFQIKSFGLDRIQDLVLLRKHFEKKEYSVAEAFKNSFGIISSQGEEAVEIVLSFDAWQGKYIKALPLHPSQKILQDDDSVLKIALFLVPTYDFYQELLKFAERLTVVSPLSVKSDFVRFIERALMLNQLNS